MLQEFFKLISYYSSDYTKTPKQYYDKNVKNIGSKFGTVIDGNKRLKNINILENQAQYGVLNPEQRFLEGVEISEDILCDCKHQEDIFEFFTLTRLHAYENDISRDDYYIRDVTPDTVFDYDRIYGHDLLAHILNYKNIRMCNNVKNSWGLDEHIRDPKCKQEFYTEKQWIVKWNKMWKGIWPKQIKEDM